MSTLSNLLFTLSYEYDFLFSLYTLCLFLLVLYIRSINSGAKTWKQYSTVGSCAVRAVFSLFGGDAILYIFPTEMDGRGSKPIEARAKASGQVKERG